MVGFILRTLISALGLWLASTLLGGIAIQGGPSLLLAAALLGVVNATVRPIVIFLTFPITIVTLGIFLWVINGLMLGLVAWLIPSFSISGFIPALFGAAIVSFTSWVASWCIGPNGRFDLLVVRRDD